MAGAHDDTAGDTAADATSGARVPFWIHQLVELLLGSLLLVQGARTGEHTAVLVTLGGLLLLLALCSDGAFGAWRWINRRVHRVLDLIAVAVLALSPLLLGLDHVLPIVILEVAAGAMLWLALRTEWRAPARRTRAAPSAPPPPPPAAESPAPSAPSPPLARTVGAAVGKARDQGPRQLGRLVGRAQRAAKAAMAPDPPPGAGGPPDWEPPDRTAGSPPPDARDAPGRPGPAPGG
jgi:hypothetical protein